MDDEQLTAFYKSVEHREIEKQNAPIVFHISGSPGSGKTTLVSMLKKQMPTIYVIDTDEILDDADPLVVLMRTFPQSSEEYVAAWKKAVRVNIQRCIDSAQQHNLSAVVFAGILNNMNGPIRGIVDISDVAHYKYFLNPPLPLLLQRFYGRYGTLKEDGEFWEGVATDMYPIPSSEQYKASHEEERVWHVDHGYVLMISQDHVLSTIQQIIYHSKEPLLKC